MKIKILCLNTWMGNVLDNLLDFIKTEQADILMLQEVFGGTDPNLEKKLRLLEIIQTELGYSHVAFSPTHTQEEVIRGNVVVSKFPLELINTVFFDIPYSETYIDIRKNYEWAPRNIQHVEAKVEGTILNLFNLHGIWGEDGRDNPRRLQMSKIIIDQIKDKTNVILAGDSNANPDTKTIGDIEHYLKNPFKNELKSSFNMKHKTNPGYATAIVDMLMVSPNIIVLDHYCPQVDVSDHLPLVATIEI